MDANSQIVRDFTVEYFNRAARGGTWLNTFWRGIPVEKTPLDLWIYQEIIYEIRPARIIETGTRWGGSSKFMGDLLQIFEIDGKVITIDIDPKVQTAHPQVEYVMRSSVDPALLASLKAEIHGRSPVMVILDSDHRKEHVLAELRAYSPFVTVGSYLILEDTIANGRPVLENYGPGPAEALEEFLPQCEGMFEVDRSREKFGLTFNPGGYLKRVK